MENMFEKYGGHEMAGGFSIKKKKLPAFIKKINAYAKKLCWMKIMKLILT